MKRKLTSKEEKLESVITENREVSQIKNKYKKLNIKKRAPN